jgi:hypothetical protein
LLASGADIQPVQAGQRLVQLGQFGTEFLAQLGYERRGVGWFGQRGIVFRPFDLEVRWQILIGVAPLLRSSRSRTRSGRRSRWQTSSANREPSLSASATVHSRKPKNLRVCARWYSTVRPLHS